MSLVNGQATIRTADKRHTLTALLGMNDPTLAGGRGGMTEVARPRRPAISEWTGTGLRTATVELLLDAWGKQGSVEPLISVINTLAPISPASEPPVVHVYDAPPIPPGVPWVIQSVVWGERLRRARDGATSRVTVALELMEVREGDVVVQRGSPAKRSKDRHSTPSRSKARTVTVKKGDTLGSIAAKYLGSASKWKSIADLNGVRDPNHLKLGQVLKLP